MEAKLITPKFVVAVVLFFIICLVGCVLDVQAKTLAQGQMPEDIVHLKLVTVENQTDVMEFQIFNNYDSPNAFIFPHSTFQYPAGKEVELQARNLLTIKCCKGSYQTVFIQDGGAASGTVETGYEGPFYISMWLQMPNAPEMHKVHVCYAVKKGQIGSIGVRIGQKGDYRLVAHDNVMFIAQ